MFLGAKLKRRLKNQLAFLLAEQFFFFFAIVKDGVFFLALLNFWQCAQAFKRIKGRLAQFQIIRLKPQCESSCIISLKIFFYFSLD